MRKKILIILIVVLSCNFATVKESISFPVGIRHLYHILAAPKDLYKPIIFDRFLFDEQGFHKTYKLNPKYFDLYDLSIVFPNKDISSKYKFSGKLFVEFLYENKVVSKKIVDRINTGWFADGDISKYKRVSLLNFEIPIVGKYKKNIEVRITVLEADKNLKMYMDSIMLHIAVSATP